MTAQELQEFNMYGCVSRSLILLAAAAGNAVTPDQFCNQFGPFPPARFGMLAISDVTAVVRGLHLGQGFNPFRRYQEVVDAHAQGRRALVCTEINPQPGAVDVVRHCSFLAQITVAGFTLRSPLQNGTDIPIALTAADWDTKLCVGIVVF